MEELWISYNQIEKMKGVGVLKKLKVRVSVESFMCKIEPVVSKHCMLLLMLCVHADDVDEHRDKRTNRQTKQ